MHGPPPTLPSGPLGGDATPPDLLDTRAAGPAAIRGSLLRAAGYLAGAAISLLSVSLLIRHIGVVEYGHFVVVVSLATLGATLSDAGLTTVAIREYVVRPEAERDRLMANLLGMRLVLTATGVGGATLFALIAGYETRLVAGTSIAGIAVLLTVLQTTYAVPLAAQLRLGGVTALDLARQILTTAATVALVVAGGTLLAFVALPIPVGIALLAVTGWLVRGTMPMRPRLDVRECLALLREVLPIAAAVAVAALYFRVTIIEMSLIASPQQSGYYATSYRILEIIVLLPGLVVGATFPVLARAARDDGDRLRYALGRMGDAMIIVGGWVAISVVLGAGFAIDVLAGGQSEPSVPVLQILGVAVALNFVATGWSFGLISLARYRAVMLITSCGLVVVLVATLLLVGLLEAQGAAIALVAGDLTQTALTFVVLRRSGSGVPFPTATVLKVLAAIGLCLLLALVPWLTSLSRTLIATVVYFGTIVVLRGMPAELGDALRRRVAG